MQGELAERTEPLVSGELRSCNHVARNRTLMKMRRAYKLRDEYQRRAEYRDRARGPSAAFVKLG